MNLLLAGGILAALGVVAAAETTSPPTSASITTLHYIGSSTIANFIRDAEPVYGRVHFALDTESESAGGEQAIMEGVADIAGVARPPRAETLAKGIVATMIGQDAIAVIVHPKNTVTGLSLAQLRGIFGGAIRNWKEVGGEDMPVHPIIVGPESATRKMFRSRVLGKEDYARCEVTRPDSNVITKVASDPVAIGQISFSFLGECGRVRPLQVDGQQPRVDNLAYPITRPLYLLWWPGRTSAARFVAWVQSEEGQSLVKRRFVGARSVMEAEISAKPN